MGMPASSSASSTTTPVHAHFRRAAHGRRLSQQLANQHDQQRRRSSSTTIRRSGIHGMRSSSLSSWPCHRSLAIQTLPASSASTSSDRSHVMTGSEAVRAGPRGSGAAAGERVHATHGMSPAAARRSRRSAPRPARSRWSPATETAGAGPASPGCRWPSRPAMHRRPPRPARDAVRRARSRAHPLRTTARPVPGRQSGCIANVVQVIDDRVGAFVLDTDRAARRLDEHRTHACLEAAIGAPAQAAQHGVDGLGMEGRQRVSGIGLETEQLAPPSRPFGALRMILVGTQAHA